MLKAEARVREGVDEQKDQLISMSKLYKNCTFLGFEIQRQHCQRVEPVLSTHSPDSET